MNHAHFMSRALKLADGQLGRTAPNPAVGCVLVRDGEIIAEAATADGGRPHAETQAIEKAGYCAGAAAYVTLEPCAHHGKTPPCAEAIVKAGIKRVVVAVRDPDPRTSGRGIEILKNAGIEVIEGVMAAEAASLNEGFFLNIKEKRPLIALKIATSADGKIAYGNPEHGDAAASESAQGWISASAGMTSSFVIPESEQAGELVRNPSFICNKSVEGRSAGLPSGKKPDGKDRKNKWITNQEARDYVHYLRSRYDAIAIGSGTLLADDPMLNCRLPGLEKYSPTRVILDRRLRIMPNHKIAATARDIPSWIFTEKPSPSGRGLGEGPAERLRTSAPHPRPLPEGAYLHSDKTEQLIKAGVKIFPYDKWLKTLAENGITRLFVEGGAELAASLLPIADELFWFSAPMTIGEGGIKAFSPLDSGNAEKLPMQLVETRFFGDNQLRYFRKQLVVNSLYSA